ncbi:MAG: hypothetical protein DIU79_01695 [Actinobacteria bacterium]|nr:MAG: hypothetical protein DIU79_01695 [Actinomycetota bacterium]
MRSLRPTALGLVALVSLSGCAFLPTQRLEFASTEDVAITEIKIVPGSGDITVRTGDVSTVRINALARYRGQEPDEVHRIEDKTLVLYSGCGRRCSASFDILAPAGVAIRGEHASGDVTLTGVSTVQLTGGSGSITATRATGPVTVETGSGDITVRDAHGSVTARTGSGDITLSRLAGPVSAQTGSGDIIGTELRGGEVTTTTGSGDIELSLDAPSDVRADATSGSIELVVPDQSYRLHASTLSGAKELHVRADPHAEHQLDLRTQSGDIIVRAR